jgi:hypothetical protein
MVIGPLSTHRELAWRSAGSPRVYLVEGHPAASRVDLVE